MERDAGFCSGGEEDDDDIHSPTDASEDSVDVKVQAISLRNNKNKRKCAEPRRVDTDLPAKKRKLDLRSEETKVLRESPFRPWNRSPPLQIKTEVETTRLSSAPSTSPSLHARDLRYIESHQEEPLSLVAKTRQDVFKDCRIAILNDTRVRPTETSPAPKATWHTPTSLEDDEDRKRLDPVPVPNPPVVVNNRTKSNHRVKPGSDKKRVKVKTEEPPVQRDDKFRIDSLLSSPGTSDFGGSVSSATERSKLTTGNGQQRNYKNMTLERTRVHTISAAFDTLRHSIPAYSHNQKLSKLSVLRIACSYIMTLSRLSGQDYSQDQTAPQLADCVETVSRTIQTEGKIRKKKDD